ncbi:MAG: hypothetical protein HQK96_20655, partial [Nitrospirae bacterium]|nr:hypothetical protein [Nitrospirota bacterium]
KRANEGGRGISDNVVIKDWKQVHDSLPRLMELFGNRFKLLDNNAIYASSDEYNREFKSKMVPRFTKEGMRMIKEPLINPIGKEIIAKLNAIGGMYLKDLGIDTTKFVAA